MTYKDEASYGSSPLCTEARAPAAFRAGLELAVPRAGCGHGRLAVPKVGSGRG